MRRQVWASTWRLIVLALKSATPCHLSDWLGGNLQAALLITSPTLLILAAIAAAAGLRHVKHDIDAAESEWAQRPAEELQTTQVVAS